MTSPRIRPGLLIATLLTVPLSAQAQYLPNLSRTERTQEDSGVIARGETPLSLEDRRREADS